MSSINMSRWDLQNNYFHKFLYSASLLGLNKRKEWIARLIAKNKVYMSDDSPDERMKELFTERIFQVIDACNSKYGDDWDIAFSMVDDYDSEEEVYLEKVELVFVHICKEVTITNSRGMSHKMKDLLLAFRFCVVTNTIEAEEEGEDDTISYNIQLQRIQGTRLSLFSPEIRAGYLHSHLNTQSYSEGSPFNFSFLNELNTFCIGGSSESVIGNLENDLNLEFDPEQFELYLYALDTLASWESLEGAPYNKMENITKHRKKTYDNAYTSRGLNLFLDVLLGERISSLDLDYFISEGRYKVKQNSKFINFLKDLIKNYTTAWQNFFVQYDRATNTYFPYSSEVANATVSSLSDRLTSQFFLYQGEKRKFRVLKEKDSQVNPDIKEFTLHPKLLENVATRIESELYKKVVRLSRITQQNTVNIT